MANYKIDRIYNDEADLTFKVKLAKGKTLASILDIVFIIKEKDDTAYLSKILEKTLLGGDISTSLNSTSDTFIFAVVSFAVADYTSLVIGNTYRAGLFCKWIGDTDFDENVEQIFDFQVIQDFHNN